VVQKAGIHIYLFVIIQIYEIPAYFYRSTTHFPDEPFSGFVFFFYPAANIQVFFGMDNKMSVKKAQKNKD
jgi:hypothetical protein